MPPDPGTDTTAPPEPAVPKPAATVLLVRDHPHPPPGRAPLQVFLQRRVTGMAFAGGMTVFPGGGVDASDTPDTTAWSGPPPTEWAERLGYDPAVAGALVQAAVRETFEECGVLLAGPGPASTVRAERVRELQEERAGLVARRRTLGQVLADAGLVLRADLLRAWARWITPTAAPKRYDTAFFVALLPEGQDADAHTTEAVEATWWFPAEALDNGRRGEMQLMLPTLRALDEIAAFTDSAAVFDAAHRRVIRPVMPRLLRRGATVAVVLPGEPEYDTTPDHLVPGRPT